MLSKEAKNFKVELHSKIGSIVFKKFEPTSHGKEVQ